MGGPVVGRSPAGGTEWGHSLRAPSPGPGAGKAQSVSCYHFCSPPVELRVECFSCCLETGQLLFSRRGRWTLGAKEAAWVPREAGGLRTEVKFNFRTIPSEAYPTRVSDLICRRCWKRTQCSAIPASYVSPPPWWFRMHFPRPFPGLESLLHHLAIPCFFHKAQFSHALWGRSSPTSPSRCPSLLAPHAPCWPSTEFFTDCLLAPQQFPCMFSLNVSWITRP